MKRSHVLILLLLCIIVSFFNIGDYINNTLLFTIFNFISIIVSITILFGNKKIESKIAWTIFVLFVPIIGVVFYLLLGVEYNRFKKFDKYQLDFNKINKNDKDDITKLMNRLGEKQDIINLINNINNTEVYLNTETEILTNGDVKYERLIEELNKAEKFIHMEYFIINEGIIFDKIKEILIKKSLSGVEVRILYDDFGCIDFSNKTKRQLKKAGIKIASFNKINFKLLRPSVNYRNHRKIVVIDNKIAFTGGINIGDEYAHKSKYYGFWRDTHILINGSAVSELNRIFIKDWYHTVKEVLVDKKYYEEYEVKNKNSGVSILEHGPDQQNDLIRRTYFKLISDAEKRIWIVTPYLILDNELIYALQIAALSGIDVRIIVPGKHDKGKLIVYKATEGYFSELLKAGVKIYKYNNCFIHSKILIIDDEIASIGTVNFDYRSFDLHFENTVLLYLDKSINKLISDFEKDLENSTQILWIEWRKRNALQKAIESLVRIFSPLL